MKRELNADRILTENDQVLSDTSVNHVHGAHGTAGVVEHPLLLGAQVVGADLLLELGNNEVDDGASVFAMGADSALGEVVEVFGVKDVELLEARVEVAVDSGEESQEDGEEAESLQGEAAAATAGAGAGGLGGFRRHLVCWSDPERKRQTFKLNFGPLAKTPEFHLWGDQSARFMPCLLGI
jgi:hypothetical protein